MPWLNKQFFRNEDRYGVEAICRAGTLIKVLQWRTKQASTTNVCVILLSSSICLKSLLLVSFCHNINPIPLPRVRRFAYDTELFFVYVHHRKVHFFGSKTHARRSWLGSEYLSWAVVAMVGFEIGIVQRSVSLIAVSFIRSNVLLLFT